MFPAKYHHYVRWGITVFLIILCSILTLFFFLRFDAVSAGFKTLTEVFAPITTGLVIAYLLSPVAGNFEKLFCKISRKQTPGRWARGASIALSIVLMIAILSVMIGMILPQVLDSVRTIAMNIDNYLSTIERWGTPLLEDYPAIKPAVMNAIAQAENAIRVFMKDDLMKLIGTLTNGMVEVGKFLYNFVLGIIVSVYLLASQDRLIGRAKKLMYAFVPLDKGNQALAVGRQTNRMFKGFIIGKLLDSSIVGVLCFLGLTLLKMPYSLLISVIIGVTNIIPYFGPFLGAIPSALLILMISPTKCLVFVIFILVLQQVDGNFIGPKVLGNTTGLSSLGVLMAILVGGGLFGVVGMIVSVPLCGVLYSIFKRMTEKRLAERDLPTDTSQYVELESLGQAGGGEND